MGIYIKGVKMSENNYIQLTLYPSGDYISRAYDLRTGEILDEHLEFEAIVEVSEPHGRLIDADACIDYIRNNNQHAWEALAYAPTIIESEVEE